MNIKLKKQPLALLVLILSLASFSVLSGTQKHDKTTFSTTVSSIPGWVKVSFGIDNEFVLLNKGKLNESYDEYVGGLIDDGLMIDYSRWIKPTYGNENLLWTYNSGIGIKKINTLEHSKKEFTDIGYNFLDGSLIVKAKEWNYSGYSVPSTDSSSMSFKSYIFVCNGNTGISIFYWGNSALKLPKDNLSIIQLLELLSHHC